MTKRTRKSGRSEVRRGWPSPSILLAGAAIFLALGGTAIAAKGLVHAADIAPGAVTSTALRNGGVEPHDLSTRTRALLAGGQGLPGAQGDAGPGGSPGTNGANGPNGIEGPKGGNGANGVNGANGPNGVNGINGTDGSDGDDGTDGTNGIDGTHGSDGVDGDDGVDGTNGIDGEDGAKGTNGVNGTAGVNGTVTPLAATKGLTVLATAAQPATVVELAVPAGNYVVLAKTQLSHTGAGDSIECTLKAGATTLDQIAMKTLPALAAIPVSLQAVTTVASPTQLSVQCRVLVASGEANFSSLIAIPTA